MPTLEWIGKEKVINHHQEVPFRVLERQYSFDKFGLHAEDNKSENKIIHALSMPGMWMQKITTKEPTDDMIEVAIEAVEAVFDWEQYLEDNGIKRTVKKSIPLDKQPLPKEYKKDREGSGYNWKF